MRQQQLAFKGECLFPFSPPAHDAHFDLLHQPLPPLPPLPPQKINVNVVRGGRRGEASEGDSSVRPRLHVCVRHHVFVTVGLGRDSMAREF